MNASHARRIRIGVVTAYRTYHAQIQAQGFTTTDDLIWRAYRRTLARLEHELPLPIRKGWRP